jgi:DNA-directed RNA polymerase subunit RPC12/RpoP
MGKDQEQRHVCKLCNETFSSGKVLGGHMRGHTSKNSGKGKKKVIKSDKGFEDGGHTGYGLRENPKKSFKFSRSEHGTSDQEIVCKVYGNWFESLRALFGHVRHPSGTKTSGIFCEECGKGFQSLRALTTHIRTHSVRFDLCNESWTHSSQKMEMDSQLNSETLGLVRRKRSNRRRYKILPNYSFSSLNGSVSFTETEQEEVEDGAICLMMLSRSGFSSVTESSDNDSTTFEVKSFGQKKRIANDNEDGIFACEVLESFKTKKTGVEDSDSHVLPSKIVLAEKRGSKFSENDSGSGSAEEMKIEMEAPIDELYRDAECVMPKLDDVSGDEIEKDSHNGMKIKPTEVEVDEDFTEDNGLDLANSGSMKSGLNKKASFDASDAELIGKSCKKMCSTPDYGSLKKSEYKCKTCNKNFHSHQALGGHQTIHRTKNSSDLRIRKCNCKLINLECSKNSVEQEMSGVSLTSCEFKETKEYKCHICFKVFASGQALGGHKRAHMIKTSETISEETLAVEHQISDICDLVDLNLPVILEKETDVDVGFKSWCVANDQKHELMVL